MNQEHKRWLDYHRGMGSPYAEMLVCFKHECGLSDDDAKAVLKEYIETSPKARAFSIENIGKAILFAGGIVMLVGLMGGSIGDASAGCEGPINGTCLVLQGGAANLAKAGSVVGIFGYCMMLFGCSAA